MDFGKKILEKFLFGPLGFCVFCSVFVWQILYVISEILLSNSKFQLKKWLKYILALKKDVFGLYMIFYLSWMDYFSFFKRFKKHLLYKNFFLLKKINIMVPYYREINYLQKYIQDELFLFILIYIIYLKLKLPIRNLSLWLKFKILRVK